MATVPWSSFVRKFAAGSREIRVQLSLDELSRLDEHGSVAVTTVELDPTDDLEKLFAPWYRSPLTPDAEWDDDGAVPCSFADIRADISHLSLHHRQKIASISADLSDRPNLHSPLELATYDLGAGQELVLDGNHRLAALVRLPPARAATQVIRYRVTAAVSTRILPDLLHWTNSA